MWLNFRREVIAFIRLIHWISYLIILVCVIGVWIFSITFNGLYFYCHKANWRPYLMDLRKDVIVYLICLYQQWSKNLKWRDLHMIVLTKTWDSGQLPMGSTSCPANLDIKDRIKAPCETTSTLARFNSMSSSISLSSYTFFGYVWGRVRNLTNQIILNIKLWWQIPGGGKIDKSA